MFDFLTEIAAIRNVMQRGVIQSMK